jgi:hypothetical protein
VERAWSARVPRLACCKKGRVNTDVDCSRASKTFKLS